MFFSVFFDFSEWCLVNLVVVSSSSNYRGGIFKNLMPEGEQAKFDFWLSLRAEGSRVRPEISGHDESF